MYHLRKMPLISCFLGEFDARAARVYRVIGGSASR